MAAFGSSTNDIASYGYYMIALTEKKQSFFVGLRSTFYRLAMITGQGLIVILAAQTARANGGPFVVKYPNGDPAAKGVLARLDPTLKPARETRLRVVKEDLTIQLGSPSFSGNRAVPPLAGVNAVR